VCHEIGTVSTKFEVSAFTNYSDEKAKQNVKIVVVVGGQGHQGSSAALDYHSIKRIRLSLRF